jgi:hypothetical protein
MERLAMQPFIVMLFITWAAVVAIDEKLEKTIWTNWERNKLKYQM